MTKTIASLFVAFLPVISACSDDGETLGSVDTADSRSFCRAAADVGCHEMYACLTESEKRDLKLPDTEDECRRKFESTCEDAVDQCDDGEHAYVPASASDCLDEMQSATCNDAADPWLDSHSCKQVCKRTAGAFRIAWEFSPAYSCLDLHVQSIAVVSDGPGGTQYVDTFDCDAYAGLTDVLPLADYSVHIELLDKYGAKMWASPPKKTVLDAAIVDAGTVIVPVETQ